MPTNRELVTTSKFLSLVLRHKPEVIGMQLDPEGWLEIDALVERANQHNHPLTLELLHQVVATNDKKRFALSEDGLRIRASQGHSLVEVDLNLQPLVPPEVLYHGTVAAFIESIHQQGLLKGSRNHVHLSVDEMTATKVGSRRGKPIILTIAAAEMHAAGHEFYRSANGVWLTDAVPPTFLRYPGEATSGGYSGSDRKHHP